MMKRILLFGIAVAAILTSCAAKREVENNVSAPVAYESDAAKGGRKTVRNVNVGEFSKMDLTSYCRVHFVQGTTCRVRLEGDGKTLDNVRAAVSGGKLTIRTINTGYHKGKEHEFEVFITAPEISEVSVSGIVTFEADKVESRSLLLDCTGLVTINIGTISAGTLSMVNSGQTSLKGKADANKIKIDNTGICQLELTADGTSLNFENGGQARVNLTYRGVDTRIENSGLCNLKAQITSGKLVMDNSGQGGMNFNFNEGDLSIENTGIGNIVGKLDCNSVSASNAGVGDVVLQGHADNVNIDSSGVSKVDTSKLNNY